MRPLTSSEKKLLIVVVGLAVVIITLVAGIFLWNLAQDLQRDINRLSRQRTEARQLLAEKELWNAREAWLQQTLQTAPPGGMANAALLTSLQNAARPLNVEILDQRFLPPEPDPYFTTAGAELTVSATLKNLVTWLHTIQTPESLTGVTRISLKSDADISKVRAEVRIVKYYRPSGSELSGVTP